MMPSLSMAEFLAKEVSNTSDTPTISYKSNADSILAVDGFFMALSAVIVMARIYVRTMMLKTFGADDYIISAAMICSILVFVCFVGETHHGLGWHTADISLQMMIDLEHWSFFFSLAVTIGISLVKISIGFFLLRLIPGKKQKWFLWGMIVFLVAFTLACVGTLIFSCVPVDANWDSTKKPTAKCFSNNTYTAIGLFNSCVNIVTDVVFALLPVPIVWNLQVNLRTRITLIGILGLGFFACACSIVKAVLQSRFLQTPDWTWSDSYFVWNAVELNIGIIAACLPALRPLFAFILETTKSLTTRRGGSSSNNTKKHKYYMQEDGIGLGTISGSSRMRTQADQDKYDVKVTTLSRQERGVKFGDEDYSIDNKSDDNILPPNGGITKTVNVIVS
ncbi:phosphatidylserine decarboxylase [Xylogone sp. PMI_703]|nr:phosphatidylserine decarboxylase [Xylogone sp. PMI_703]